MIANGLCYRQATQPVATRNTLNQSSRLSFRLDQTMLYDANESETALVVARTWVVAAAGVVGLPSGFSTNNQWHAFAEDQP